MTHAVNETQVALGAGRATTLQRWGDAGPVVLCVHGITSSRRSWSRLGERLEPLVRVFAYDQTGHGDSARSDAPLSLERSVDDLRHVAEALPAPVDLLVGHSWGGAVALLGGRALAPGRVLAIDPMIRVAPGTFDSDYVDDLRETLALPRFERERAVRAMYAGAHPADVDAKLHAMLPMSIGALERLGRENRTDAGGWDLRERLVAYPVPLAIFVAGEDSVISAEDLAFVRDRGGPNVCVRIFEGEGHNLQRTAFDEFVPALVAFLG